ncbi:uncharacterized protein DS421_6g190610 [Arachis hypogaea]|nr:uncharacterized protein DS421_6g190610 [Arachis hypogaea]
MMKLINPKLYLLLPQRHSLTGSLLSHPSSLPLSAPVFLTVSGVALNSSSLSRLRSLSWSPVSHSVALARLPCPRHYRRQKQQVPGLVVVVAPCLVTVSQLVLRLRCARRCQRQKQQVPGLPSSRQLPPRHQLPRRRQLPPRRQLLPRNQKLVPIW